MNSQNRDNMCLIAMASIIDFYLVGVSYFQAADLAMMYFIFYH